MPGPHGCTWTCYGRKLEVFYFGICSWIEQRPTHIDQISSVYLISWILVHYGYYSVPGLFAVQNMLNLSHYEHWFGNVLTHVANITLPAQILIQEHSQELTSFFQLVFTYSLQTSIIYINVMICMINSRIWRFQNNKKKKFAGLVIAC